MRLVHLTSSRFFGGPERQMLGLARALPSTRGNCLRPYYEAHWAGTCRRGCGQARVALTAPPPRSPRTLCPGCDRERLERHVGAWMAVVNAG